MTLCPINITHVFLVISDSEEDDIKEEVEEFDELEEIPVKKRFKKDTYSGPMQCYLCGEEHSKDDIQDHIKEKHQFSKISTKMFGIPRTHQCSDCKMVFKTSDDLSLHICGFVPPSWKSGTEESRNQCPKCDKIVSNYKTLLEHYAAVHTKEKKFNCDQCDYKACTPKEVKRHKENIHEPNGARNFACDQCDYKATNRNSLYAHKREHSREPVHCEICRKAFTRLDTLKRHLASVHSDQRAFESDLCEYKGKTANHLRQHKQKVHENYRPHICDCCGKRFYRFIEQLPFKIFDRSFIL